MLVGTVVRLATGVMWSMIASIVLLIGAFLFVDLRFDKHPAIVKDDVACLVITFRHSCSTLTSLLMDRDTQLNWSRRVCPTDSQSVVSNRACRIGSSNPTGITARTQKRR